MLDKLQRNALTIVIALRLPANPTVALVEPYVGLQRAVEMPPGTLLQIAEWILDTALAQPDPEMFIRIIGRVDDGQPRMGSLVDLATELEDHPGSWRSTVTRGAIDLTLDGDPLELLDGRPFVDRRSFREILPRLGTPVEPDAPTCLVIKGHLGQGKSYLHEFCRKLAAHWEGAQRNMFRVGISECPGSGLASLPPSVPAFELASGLKPDVRLRPRIHEDPHRYARNLATWIATATPAGPLPALAILDGYGDPGIAKPVRTFIETLLRIVQTNDKVKARMRVILLDYDVGRLEDAELVYQDSVLEHIGDEEIDGWLRKRFPGLEAYLYEDAVATINESAPQNGEFRMRHICAMIQALSPGFEAA